MVVGGNEGIGVDKTSQTTTNKRANPVDPVVMKVTIDKCRAKGTCRVHGSP